MKTMPDNIRLQVLGFMENDEWVALALEMDLRAYGDTFDDAMKELLELIDMQLSFAAYKKKPEMIFKRAEKKYFDLYATAKVEVLENIMRGRTSPVEGNQVSDVPIPNNWRSNSKHQFVPARATA